MLNDNLTNNGCSNTSQLDDKVKRLEDIIDGYDQRFNTQDLHTQKLTANNANIANLESAGVKSDSVDAGALTADSVAVTGSIKAKSFTVEDPVLVNGVTSPTANIGTVDATDVNAVNGKITNLTVENLMTAPDSSLEYKNISVTNQATINKLNLIDPHVAEIIADNTKTIDLEVQNVKQLNEGKIIRGDTNANVISYVNGATILGDLENDINIAGRSRPKWNDLSLATLADIQTGGVKPVYRGEVENFSQLPPTGNAKGDLYVVRKLVIADKMGIGHAQWNGESWDPTLIYELELFETAADFEEAVRALTTLIEDNAKAIEDEMQDAVNRESAIVDGIKGSRVKKVEEGCTMGDAGNLLATTDDAFMLYGAEGPDNIPSSVTSLDNLKTCSQYSVSESKSGNYTDKPKDETGAFDITVGYFNTDKNQPYQVYISKKTNSIYYRNSTDGVYDEWIKLAKESESLQFRSKTRIPKNSDLNNYDNPGQFYIYNGGDAETISHMPPGAESWPGDLYIMTSCGASKGDVIQIFIAWANGTTSMRGKYTNSWTDWRQLATAERTLKQPAKLQRNADLDTLESGVYYADSPIFDTLAHKPKTKRPTSWGYFTVGAIDTTHRFQMYVEDASAWTFDGKQYATNDVYIRTSNGDGSTYKDWVNISNIGYKGVTANTIPDGTDMDSFITPGKYYVFNNSAAETIKNRPKLYTQTTVTASGGAWKGCGVVEIEDFWGDGTVVTQTWKCETDGFIWRRRKDPQNKWAWTKWELMNEPRIIQGTSYNTATPEKMYSYPYRTWISYLDKDKDTWLHPVNDDDLRVGDIIGLDGLVSDRYNLAVRLYNVIIGKSTEPSGEQRFQTVPYRIEFFASPSGYVRP